MTNNCNHCDPHCLLLPLFRTSSFDAAAVRLARRDVHAKEKVSCALVFAREITRSATKPINLHGQSLLFEFCCIFQFIFIDDYHANTLFYSFTFFKYLAIHSFFLLSIMALLTSSFYSSIYYSNTPSVYCVSLYFIQFRSSQ